MTTWQELLTDSNKKPAELLDQAKGLARPSESEKLEIKALLRDQVGSLFDVPEGLAEKLLKEWKATRGYSFETLVFKVLALEGLDPTPPFYAHMSYDDGESEPKVPKRGRRPGGEQIDGSFLLNGRHFLIEAKWTPKIAASDMYAFRGRVDGKLTGTVGVMVSAEGYVEDAQYALLWGKELNVLLVDGGDIKCALDPLGSFHEMMRVKLREAARLGRPYYSYLQYLDEQGA